MTCSASVAGLDQLVEVDAGRDAHAVQHVRRGPRSRGCPPRRARTGSRPAADRRVERRDAELEPDEHVRERGAARVVHVQRDLLGAASRRGSAARSRASAAGVADADRVAERDLVARPASSSFRAIDSARRGSTSPSYGQPHTVDTYARTARPASRACGDDLARNARASRRSSCSRSSCCASRWRDRKTAISFMPAVERALEAARVRARAR